MVVALAGKSFYLKVILHREMREKGKKPDYLEKKNPTESPANGCPRTRFEPRAFHCKAHH